jgi:hypothetical protein
MIGKTMTTARRRLGHFPRLPLAVCLAVVLGPGGFHTLTGVRAATSELVVIDHRSGLAIHGYDPVAYFVDGRAVEGREGVEHPFAGAVWRFHNPGNRAAFMADPDIYLPRYGGYDPVAVARGVAAAGDPRLWLIVERRLYFFYDQRAREAFAAGAAAIAAAADKRWPSVRQTLSP